MDFGKMEEEYFCVEDWTGVIRLKWLRKIKVLAQQILDGRRAITGPKNRPRALRSDPIKLGPSTARK